MTLQDVILKMHAHESLVISGDSFYYFHTTPDDLTNDYDLEKYLSCQVTSIRYAPAFNAIWIEIDK